jgi:enolase
MTIFLNGIQKKLNEIGNISFGYKITDDTLIFSLYETKNTVFIEYPSADDYRSKNALKYIKKSRKLNDKQLVYIEGKFKEHSYDKMSEVTRSRLDKNIIGNDYLKWFVDKCNELQL